MNTICTVAAEHLVRARMAQFNKSPEHVARAHAMRMFARYGTIAWIKLSRDREGRFCDSLVLVLVRYINL